MPIITGNKGFELVWFDQEMKDHYIEHISIVLKDQFGEGPFTTKAETRKVLFFLFEGLVMQAKHTLSSERSLAFYQYIQILHETSNQVIIEHSVTEIFDGFSDTDFSMYRRVLKFLIEQACNIPLVPGESVEVAKVRGITKLEELIHIGDQLFGLSNLMSSQDLIEDAVEIFFLDDGRYVIDYKHNYNEILDFCSIDNSRLRAGAIYDESGFSDFNNATKDVYGAQISYLLTLVKGMHQKQIDEGEPFPYASLFDWHSLVANFSSNTEIEYDIAHNLISGLIVNEATKCSFEDSISKPFDIRRHLFRPIIQWQIEGYDANMVFVGEYGLSQSLNSLSINAIGWQKYPDEWKNDDFTSFVYRKDDERGDILEDAIEDILKSKSIIYDRNIESLYDKSGTGENLVHDKCGEIDFLIVMGKTILLTDAKYLLDKHDMNNWKGDQNKFVTDNNNYNDKIARKKVYLEARMDRVIEHLEHKTGKTLLQGEEYSIECLFIVNTPTFYMFNSRFEIICIADLEMKLEGNQIYKPIQFEKDGYRYSISHPYFTLENHKVEAVKKDL